MKDYLFVIKFSENPDEKLNRSMKIGGRETNCREFAESFGNPANLRRVMSSALTFFDGEKKRSFEHGQIDDKEQVEFPYSEYIANVGMVGIVKFPDSYNDETIETVFQRIRDFVGCLNGLIFDEEKFVVGTIDSRRATWARAPMIDVVKGFRFASQPDPDIENNFYLITNLQGGIGGKH